MNLSLPDTYDCVRQYNPGAWLRCEEQIDVLPWTPPLDLPLTKADVTFYNPGAWERGELPVSTGLWRWRIPCWNIRTWIEKGCPEATSAFGLMAAVMLPAALVTWSRMRRVRR